MRTNEKKEVALSNLDEQEKSTETSIIVHLNIHERADREINSRVNLIKWMTLESLQRLAIMIFNLQQLRRNIVNYRQGRRDFTMFS